MPSALNFAAQAARDVRRLAGGREYPDTELMRSIATVIESAQHFQLPDGGRLLDSGLRGLEGRTIELPFPLVTVEYMVPKEMHRLTDDRPVQCTRRLALAQSVPPEECMLMCDNVGAETDRKLFEDGGIQIVVVDNVDSNGFWTPIEVGFIAPKRLSGIRDKSGENLIVGHGYPILPQRLEMVLTQIQRKRGTPRSEVIGAILKDLEDEVSAVMALCEACACSNVRSEPIQRADPRVNARRARDGKLPLYEVRVLTVEVPGSSGERRSLGGHHASPRQHLRRGHVRRYESGKQVWVNAHLVGDPARGRIGKTYDLRGAA